jgi:hypothetical protein
MQQSEQIGSLAAALAKAQLEIANPEFDAVNPHFKNKYASLAAHTESLRKPLAKQGIAIVQSISTTDHSVCVTTRLIHASGEWLADGVSMALPEKATAQVLGSFVTYLRRYSLAAFGLVVGEPDDDGEEDRKNRPTFNPSAAKGATNKPPSKPNKPSDDFLSEAAPIRSASNLDPLIGSDRADEILSRLSAIRRNPVALLAAIESQGFDVSDGIAGLPESILPRVESWVAKAVQANGGGVAEQNEESFPQGDEKPSRLDTLRTRRSSKGG